MRPLLLCDTPVSRFTEWTRDLDTRYKPLQTATAVGAVGAELYNDMRDGGNNAPIGEDYAKMIKLLKDRGMKFAEAASLVHVAESKAKGFR